MTTIASQLADSYAGLEIDDLPHDAVTVARQCVLDWLGCALAGSDEPLSEVLRDELLEAMSGPSTIVGHGGTTSAVTAALINGAAGHALDYDDTHTTMSGHPTAPVLPAVLALAEQLGSPGAKVLTALVIGIEVECRLGAVLGPEHYGKGWHATGTLGVFGAAAACARLLDLDSDRWGHALGLAGTQSSGLKASFGTMAKPFHAGRAAADGLLAARLAARGFTANPAVVEAAQGLAEAAGAGRADADRLERYDGRWLITETLFKYHAACYLTHAAIDAAAALRGDVGDVSSIEAVDVTVHPSLLGVCAIERPRTGLEGKFSVRATTAMSLLGDDTADPALYTDGRVAEEDVVSLRDRVTVHTEPGHPTTWSAVRVRTSDGRELSTERDSGTPASDLDDQGRRLRAKFDALATPVIGGDAAAALADEVSRLGDQPDVVALLRNTVRGATPVRA